MMTQKPLMLKDYLEIDANSESSGSFRSAPGSVDAVTVRYLLEADLCGKGRMIAPRTKSALTKISAVINAVRFLPFSSSSSTGCRPNQGRFLPRSISKKLKRSFWRKKVDQVEETKFRVKDIVRLKSFEDEGEERRSLYFPSPVVSSCSSWSEGDSSGSDFLLSTSGSSEFFGENDAAGESVGSDSKAHVTDQREPKELDREGMECSACLSEEEKEQLSPVSVMDFPYQEEEEEATTSPCFDENVAHIERTKQQLLQKIRRFESLAELDAVDLEQRFASETSDDYVASDEEEEDEEERSTDEKTASELLQRLRASFSVGSLGSIEKLLVDFVNEGLSCSFPNYRQTTGAARLDGEELLLRAARDWIDGGGYSWEVEEERRGEAEVREMEKNGGWRYFESGQQEVEADVEVGVLGWLMEELVSDLLSSSS